MKNLKKSEKVLSNIRLLEAWIECRMAYQELPGMSVGIVYDQELIWAKGFGFSNREEKKPATTKTLYRIASITKLFTSTAIMQLRDQGKLHLDDPVKKHLPWFKIKSSHTDAPEITIRHLLTHTSGLPREAAFPYWNDFQFPTREQIIEKLPVQEAAYGPEAIWKYSNLALTLAGEIVAAVSGEPYPDYIQKHILGPLEMKSTSVVLPEGQKTKLAKGYGRRLPDGSRRLMPFTDSRGITPAANISSNVEDLARFLSLQFTAGKREESRILKKSTIREMHRVHWMQPDWKSGWGLGFGIRRSEDRVILGHGGSLAGYRSQVSFCPEEKFGAVVLTNASDGEPNVYMDQIFHLVAPAVKESVKEPSGKEKKPDASMKKYMGRYRNIWGDSQVLWYEGELVMINPRADDPTESMAKLVSLGENTFRMEGEAGYMCLGELVQFEMSSGGKVRRVKEGETYIYPVESWYDRI